MRFEIPFDEKTSRKHSQLIFDLYWNEAIKKNNKLLYHITGCILFGSLVVYGKNNIGFIFISLGIYFLMNLINFRIQYKKNKKIYFKKIEDHINCFLSNNTSSIWELLDETFFYSDFRFDLNTKWNVFNDFKLIDDIIILEVKDSIVVNFILEKEEVGSENFEKIITFLKLKIKKDGIL